MTKCLLYMAPIVLVGVVATEASAYPAAWGGSMVRNIAATVPEGTGAPLVLVPKGGPVEAVAAGRARRRRCSRRWRRLSRRWGWRRFLGRCRPRQLQWRVT